MLYVIFQKLKRDLENLFFNTHNLNFKNTPILAVF